MPHRAQRWSKEKKIFEAERSRRRRQVHGWAFNMHLTEEDQAGVRRFLETGDESRLPMQYRTKRE